MNNVDLFVRFSNFSVLKIEISIICEILNTYIKTTNVKP